MSEGKQDDVERMVDSLFEYLKQDKIRQLQPRVAYFEAVRDAFFRQYDAALAVISRECPLAPQIEIVEDALKAGKAAFRELNCIRRALNNQGYKIEDLYSIRVRQDLLSEIRVGLSAWRIG